MPEMHFRVSWPNGSTNDCYSPSSIIQEYLCVGRSYAVDDFVERCRSALNVASERVRQRYGFSCTSALDQLTAIERTAAGLSAPERSGKVAVLSFTRHAPRDARAKTTESEHHPVLVVGGGQAGLSTSYLLKQASIPHLVLEAERVAHSWRMQRWDSFCLVTPNWQCQLPGHPYEGDDPYGFMKREAIVQYVESYASRHLLPVREGVTVQSLTRREVGGFLLSTTAGQLTADQVVIATGSYQMPHLPEAASRVATHIRQLHSVEYKSPEQLPSGAVLVVGTGQSGCQIAEDLHLAGRQVHLSVGSAPRCARRYRGRDVVEWLQDMGHYDMPIDRHPNRERVRDKTNHYVTGRDGGRDIDLRKLALEGMQLYGPFQDANETLVHFAPELERNLDAADDVYRSINRSIDAYIEQMGIDAAREAPYQPVWAPQSERTELDLLEANVTSMVWCVGFRSDFSWIQLPVLDEGGYPRHDRGVTETEGLYFIGLPWLYTWGSGRFSGVGRDAAHLVETIRKVSHDRRVPGLARMSST